MGKITLFLCGDVMLGRGIDQILPYASDPVLHEPYINNARRYVELAERVNGPIPLPVDFQYVWGDALPELERVAPDIRIINLETSITNSSSWCKTKQVHYKMSPANVPCLTTANIDCCTLSNNHILDWGYSGLAETVNALRKGNLKVAGAGMNVMEAERPAVMEVAAKGRVIVVSLGSVTSGIPKAWAASEDKAGVNLLEDFSDETIRHIGHRVGQVKATGDVVVASVHWGANWGYDISNEEIEFAHKVIDHADIDIVYGHSSHHVKGIEVYKGKAILYGCGDFLNDYEGIGGYEVFRGDLGLMYFLTTDALSGELTAMELMPIQIKRLRVNRGSRDDALWLTDTLHRESKRFGVGVRLGKDNILTLQW